MSLEAVVQAVEELAAATQAFSDADLDQPWAWGPHAEGVRFALIGSCHELNALAVRLQRARPQPPTAAQLILAQYHTAYRELQAVLCSVPAELYDRVPAPGEWPLRIIVGHIVGGQRHFFTLVQYAVRRQNDPALPVALPDDAVEQATITHNDFGELRENAPLADLLAYHASLHAQTLRDFAGLTDAQLNSPSLWWEEIEYDLVHRLLRMEAHLRQHMIQAEKTLAALDHPLTEARRLLRLLYRALAGVEAALLGAPAAAEDDLANLVAALTARAADVAATVTQARALLQAVSADDATAVSTILTAQPTLANARSQAGLSAVITAAYMQRRQALAALQAAGPRLSVHDAAAVGDLARVQELVGAWPGYANQMARDGFSPLQLACFFNQEAVALWLIAHGADVCAVAQNAQRIQPLHAVATNGNLAIVQALLDHGADVNAAQAQDFTALHTAADNGDAPLAELLLAHGANPAAPDADGRSPRDHALARGHTAVANLLVAG